MIELDRESILRATPEKRFLVAQKELHANFNKETAEAYHKTYENMALSFIMDHSREIFSEPFYGYAFYENIIKHALINPLRCEAEETKLEEYISSLEKKSASSEQIEKAKALLATLKVSIPAKAKNIMKPVLVDYDNSLEYLNEVFDFLYEGYISGDTTILDSAAEEIFGSTIPHVQVYAGFILCLINKDYVPYLVEATNDISNAMTEAEYEFGASVRSIISMMMHIPEVSSIINGDRFGYRLKLLWNNVGRTPLDSALTTEEAPDIYVEYVDISDIHPSVNVMSIMEELEHSEEFQKEKYRRIKNQIATINGTLKTYPMLEEIEDIAEKAIYQNLLDKKMYLESELDAMEWEADGRPNAVLAAEIKTSRDLAAKNERRPMYRQLVGNNTAVARSAEAEDKLCDSIQKDIEIAKNPKASESELAGVKSRVAGYEKDIEDNDYENARMVMDRLNRRIYSEEFASRCGDLGDVELAEFLNKEVMFEDEDLPDPDPNKKVEPVGDENPKQKPQNSKNDSGKGTAAPKEKEKKPESQPPKRELVDRIQDAALDHEADAAAKRAKRKVKLGKLKTAGRAVTSSPRRAVDGVKSVADNFEKMDDNRRKRFLLKPGNRHRICKTFKTAMKFGAIKHIKLTMIPFFAMLNHFSKEKDKRIRNELIRELETEIKICEEKINDANSDGDKKEKYELMRIHDKLVAEKTRVSTNSKYI